MFKSLADAVANNQPVVIIVLTAGDDNKGYQEGKPDAYWYLRHHGHEVALTFLVSRLQKKVRVDRLNSKHAPTKVNNLYMYNLMLPDGLLRKGDRWTYLSELVSDSGKRITSVDGQFSYDKVELVENLTRIFIEHRSRGGNYLHVTDENLDQERDHQDHKITSALAIEAFLCCWQETRHIYRYQTYANHDKDVNIEKRLVMLHAATWGIYNCFLVDGYQELSGARQLDYLGKQYQT